MKKGSLAIAVAAVAVSFLGVVATYNYLLFHSLVEIVSIVIAAGMFMVVWNTRSLVDNHYFLVIGVSSLFVGGIDLLHTLSYSGMAIFPDAGANLPTQFWIAGRYLQASSFLVAPFFVTRRIRPDVLFGAAAVAFLLLVVSIFTGHFPICYTEGVGLTPFKRGSEYAVCGIFAISLLLLLRQRLLFAVNILRLLLAVIVLSIAAELAFTLYASVNSGMNMLGHFLKLAAFYFAYKAIIETAFLNPYHLIFLRLKQNEEELLLSNEELEMRVRERTAELDASNRALRAEIGERRQVEEALRESEKRYKSLVTNIPGTVYHCRFDADRTMEFISTGIEVISGFGAADFIGNRTRSFAAIIHPEDAPGVAKAIGDAVRRKTAYMTEYRIVAADGAFRWVSEKGQAIADGGSGELWLDGVIFDITERKVMEEEKRNLRMQLLQAQKLESLGRLAGGVAHDFNNVLTGIIGFCELLLMKMEKDRSEREYVQIILDSGNRAAELTGQLLAFSRKQVLEMRPVNVNAVIDEATKMLGRIIGEDVAIEVKATDMAVLAMADAAQLEQVLFNLAVNGRDAMPGGGTLLVETDVVAVDGEYAVSHSGVARGRYVVLTVTDTGEGMSREVQERIFEPFFTTKEQGKGTGLGLATVYGIVKQHNGHIWVYSEPGIGTSFKIYLPVYDGVEVEEEEQAEAVERRGTEKVLVVDDEPYVRKLVMETLAPLGYVTYEAGSGEEALRFSETFHGEIDLLLVDVIMPGMNGRQLAGLLENHWPAVRTVFMSGYTDSYLTAQNLAAEGILFLQKPLSAARIADTVRDALEGEPS